MREIKFRAWDPKGDNPQSKGLKGVMMCWEYLRQNNKLWKYEDKGCYIMQYTGLKDKNGVEIYEGDILEWYATTGKHNGKIYRNQVYWLNYRYRVKGTKNKKTFHTDLTFNLCWNHKVKIIGNIHETKVNA